MIHIWTGYFWPSIQGNGPEALVQTIVYGTIAIILVPPIRRWFKAEYERIHAKIDFGHKELHKKLDHNADVLHHIVKHTRGIPDLPPKEKE